MRLSNHVASSSAHRRDHGDSHPLKAIEHHTLAIPTRLAESRRKWLRRRQVRSMLGVVLTVISRLLRKVHLRFLEAPASIGVGNRVQRSNVRCITAAALAHSRAGQCLECPSNCRTAHRQLRCHFHTPVTASSRATGPFWISFVSRSRTLALNPKAFSGRR